MLVNFLYYRYILKWPLKILQTYIVLFNNRKELTKSSFIVHRGTNRMALAISTLSCLIIGQSPLTKNDRIAPSTCCCIKSQLLNSCSRMHSSSSACLQKSYQGLCQSQKYIDTYVFVFCDTSVGVLLSICFLLVPRLISHTEIRQIMCV